MPLSESSLIWHYSGKGVDDSFGGTISAVKIVSGQAENVFDDVTGDESEVGDKEFRAIALKNVDPTYDFLNVKAYFKGCVRASGEKRDTLWFALEAPSRTPLKIQSLDPRAETTPPNSLDFTVADGSTVAWTPENAVDTQPSNTLNYQGKVAAGNKWMGIWLKRVVPAGAAAFSDRTSTFEVKGETTGSPYMTIVKTYEIRWNEHAFDVREISSETEIKN